MGSLVIGRCYFLIVGVFRLAWSVSFLCFAIWLGCYRGLEYVGVGFLGEVLEG